MNGNPEGQTGLRLRVEFGRSNGEWAQPYPKITDNGNEFFLDPNDPEAIRITPRKDAGPWWEFNMDRLRMIHRLLLEAQSKATVGK